MEDKVFLSFCEESDGDGSLTVGAIGGCGEADWTCKSGVGGQDAPPTDGDLELERCDGVGVSGRGTGLTDVDLMCSGLNMRSSFGSSKIGD